MRMDKRRWPGCLLWYGWLSFLSGVNGDSPWAKSAAEGAGNLLECSLGSSSPRLLLEWDVPDEFDREDVARLLDKVSGASSAESGCVCSCVWSCLEAL